MSTIKSSDEHLTLNADGSSKDIKFQANGVEKASISSAGAFTSTTIDATKLTGTIPNFTSTGIDDNADATAITINSGENVGIGVTPESHNASWTGVDIAGVGNLTGETATSAGNQFTINNNAYLNTSGNWAYKQSSDEACQLQMFDGKFRFRTAPTGTADGNVTFTERLLIDNSGRVTMPLQPSFWASGTVASGNNVMTSNQEFVFSNAQSNVGSHYSTSTGRFTAPVAGAYLFSGTVYGSPAGASYRWTIKKNNNQFSAGGGSNDCVPHGYNSVNLASTCTLILQLAANDYVSCSVRSGQTCALYGGHSYFSGVLVG